MTKILKAVAMTVFLLFFVYPLFAQRADKIVTLIATGQGKTSEEAKVVALRSALEQAFGTFISSKTEILNDKIIKDEIVSVSTGNIQSFEILSEIFVPNNKVAVSVSADVSINKLSNYCAAKGISVEFKGGLFAENAAIQTLNQNNESKAWENYKNIIYFSIDKIFDRKITVSTPQFQRSDTLVEVPIIIDVDLNSNFQILVNNLFSFISSLSMKKNEVSDYLSMNREVFPLVIYFDEDKYGTYFFRNKSVQEEILDIPNNFFQSVLNNTIIDNSLTKYSLRNFLITKSGHELNFKDQNIQSGYVDDKHLYGFFKGCSFKALGIFGENTDIIISNNSGKLTYGRNDDNKTFRYSFNSKNPSWRTEFGELVNYSTGNPRRYLGITCEGFSLETLNYYLFGYLSNLDTNFEIPESAYKNARPYLTYKGYILNPHFLRIQYSEEHSINELKNISNYKVN